MNITGFITSAILLTLMPGPDILFVIAQSVNNGKKHGITFASGLCTGLIFHIAAVILGLSAIIAASATAFSILKLAGAAYLLTLGIKSFMAIKNAKGFETGQKIERTKLISLYKRGILMNILNPKVIIFFLAFFPQFIDKSDNPAPQMLLLGALFIVQAFCIFSAVACIADKLTQRLMHNSKFAKGMAIAESIIYCIIGISIVFT